MCEEKLYFLISFFPPQFYNFNCGLIYRLFKLTLGMNDGLISVK